MSLKILLLLSFLIGSLPYELSAATVDFPQKLEKTPEKLYYYGQLDIALSRIIPRNERQAFFNSLADGRRSEVIQILRTRRMASLTEALNEFDANIEKRYGKEKRYAKLSPAELSIILHFYRWLDPKENSLVKNYMTRRLDTRIAQQPRRVTRWPFIRLRKHGQDLPPARFDTQAWEKVDKLFLYPPLKLQTEYLFIRVMLVQFEAAHNTYRQVNGLAKKVVLEIQDMALVNNEPHIAKRAFLAYLANTKSEEMFDKYGTDLNEWPESIRAKGSSLAQFILEIQAIKDRRQLLRFFARGQLPQTIKAPKSLLVQEALEIFQSNAIEGQALKSLYKKCR
jgi:hypothetical protein